MRIHHASIAPTSAGLLLVAAVSCHASFKSGSNSEPKSPATAATSSAAGGATSVGLTSAPTAAVGGTSGTTMNSSTAAGGSANSQSTGTAAPTSGVKMAGVKIQPPGNLVFQTGKATLEAGSGNDAILEELRLFLEQNPKVTQMRIEGHTDNVGKTDDNLELSGQRALTIKNWLVGKGIAAERLIAVGFGDVKPLADNSSEAGRAQNRRTEFKVAGWQGKKYLGRDPKGGGKEF